MSGAIELYLIMYVNSGARIKASAVGAKSEEPPSEGLTALTTEREERFPGVRSIIFGNCQLYM